MCANLTVWSPSHLSVVEIRVHGGSRIDKPSIDEVGYVGGIVGQSRDNRSHCIVQDSIRHGLEVACVVDHAAVRVEQSVASIIRACNPN